MEMQPPEAIGTFDPRGTIVELIERTIKVRGLGKETDEESEALHRLLEWTERFGGDLASFLNALSLERGIDHGSLVGDRVDLMSLHAANGNPKESLINGSSPFSRQFS